MSNSSNLGVGTIPTNITLGEESLSSISTVVMFLIVFVVTIYVVIYLVKTFRKTDLKTVTLVKKAIKIPLYGSKIISNDEDLPSLYNGVEYAYSMWLYVEQHRPTNRPKLIMFRGSDSNLSSAATPIFYMDANYVKMHCMIKTNKPKKDRTNRNTLSDFDNYPDCDYLRLTVDYVPMQRWVNVLVVVDNEYVQLFFDGELRKVVDITDTEVIENFNRDASEGEYRNDGEDGCKITQDDNGDNMYNKCCDNRTLCCNDRRIYSKLPGDNFYVGKINEDEVVEGYLSKVQFFNYAITLDHARLIYQSGPLHRSWLSQFGLPLYGLRNPVYRIDAVQDVDDGTTINDENK